MLTSTGTSFSVDHLHLSVVDGTEVHWDTFPLALELDPVIDEEANPNRMVGCTVQLKIACSIVPDSAENFAAMHDSLQPVLDTLRQADVAGDCSLSAWTEIPGNDQSMHVRVHRMLRRRVGILGFETAYPESDCAYCDGRDESFAWVTLFHAYAVPNDDQSVWSMSLTDTPPTDTATV